jgi:hypothetical protein
MGLPKARPQGRGLRTTLTFKRHQRQLRILKSRLGRIILIRDIRRKIEGQPAL